MKHFKYLLLLACLSFQTAMAQIQVSPLVIDNDIDGLSAATSVIENKLRTVLSQNGILSSYGDSRFVLTAKFDVLDKQALTTVPVKIIAKLNVTLGIGDGIDGTCYGTTSFEITGAASTDEQAIINAVKRFNGKNGQISELVNKATESILAYYENNGPTIVAQARSLIKSGRYEEAMYVLSAIPMECSSYKEAQTLIAQSYRSNVNHNSAQVLAAAKASWAADPSEENAQEIAEMLSEIDTSSPSYAGAKQLMNQMESRFKQRENREYQLRVKEMDQEYALNKAQIKAVQNIAVAYAKSRPRVVYNTRVIHTWW